MAINNSSINTSAVNAAAGFSPVIASGTLVEIEQIVGEVASGSLVQVEQVIGIAGLGSLVDFEQTLELKLVASGSLVDIEQTINTLASGTLVNIEQYIYVDRNNPTTWFQRNGWDVIIKIGGEEIAKSKIHGEISIERKEQASALAEFTLIPDLGVQDLDYYSGKTITIDSITSSGVVRLFTGVVDIPVVDILDKKITIKCSDRRLEKINSELANVVPNIGFYSDEIFTNTDADLSEQLRNRLTTVPQTLDFDAYGNYHLSNLLAKSTQDYTLSNSSVFRRQPTVDFLSRARITNTVKVEYKYRYPRLYHWTRNFTWRSQIADSFCLFLQSSYQLTPKIMILQAAQAAGWPIDGIIRYTDIPGAGWYCGGIGWMATSSWGTFSQTLDANGNVVSDPSGNASYSVSNTVGNTNLSVLFATTAAWTAGTRWAQTVEESYSFNIVAPQSVNQYGTVESFEGTEFETQAQTENWENYKSYDDLGLGQNFTVDLDVDRNKFYNIQATVINTAKTKIISSHRDTRVKFQTALWSVIDLRHTVRLNTTDIVAKGKVMQIRHTLDVNTGADETEVTLALSRATGSTTTNVPSYLGKPSDVAFSPETSTINFYSRYGQNPDSTLGETWTGYIGNITAGANATNFASRFVVDTPPIPTEYRDTRVLTGSSGSYNLQLQNDELVITF